MSWHIKGNNGHVECSLIGQPPVVYLESIPRQKIELLMEAYPHQEWLGYLKGRIKHNIFVEDLVIPPHKEASGASAEAEPFHIPKDCVGILHSHHQMGAFHSGTDQAFVDKNFPVSITVAKRAIGLEFDTVCYQVTPCGKGTTGKSLVKYVQPEPQFDTEGWLKKVKENIDKGKYECSYESNRGQPRDKQGHFIKKQPTFLPIRFNKEIGTMLEYVTDANGRVLSDTELIDILANSTEA